MPEAIEQKLRAVCLALPETYEEKAWAGRRWMVRKKNFCHVLTVDDNVLMTFRSVPPELDALANMGHPFFALGWGRNAIGMLLDDETDWDEVAELVADSYCVVAPKKLASILNDATPRQ